MQRSISRLLGMRIPVGNNSGNLMHPNMYLRQLCMSRGQCSDQTLGRVIELVKKFDGIDGGKVTEKADFQKDLSLDSLDKVELVMALEQEFSVEIPDEKAEKLRCCGEVASYIISESKSKEKV